MPRWEDLIGEEDSHDGNLMHDWAFSQNSLMSRNIQFEPSTKENLYNVSN